MNQQNNASMQAGTLIGDAPTPNSKRNNEILIAYLSILMDLKRMLRNNLSKDKQRFAQFQHPHQLKDPEKIGEFVCSYCSIILKSINGEYTLKLTIGREAYYIGSGLNSNALLRLAFKYTMSDKTKLMIENCLDIKFNPSYDSFIQRMDEFEH